MMYLRRGGRPRPPSLVCGWTTGRVDEDVDPYNRRHGTPSRLIRHQDRSSLPYHSEVNRLADRRFRGCHPSRRVQASHCGSRRPAVATGGRRPGAWIRSNRFLSPADGRARRQGSTDHARRAYEGAPNSTLSHALARAHIRREPLGESIGALRHSRGFWRP